MDSFKQALEVCELRDLGYEGDLFTWRNQSHRADMYIRERLDRTFATQSWCDQFPYFRVVNGDMCHSDHRPIIITTEGKSVRRRCQEGPRHFRFKAKWLEEEDYSMVIQNAWKTYVDVGPVKVKDVLAGVGRELMD